MGHMLIYTNPARASKLIKTNHRIRRPSHSIVTLPFLRRDVLLLQLCHMCQTRSLAEFLDEFLHGALIALGFAFDL